MRYRTLGGSGLRVSELFLGAMRFDAEHAPAIVDAYADAGGNVIDTASAYGDSEKILGGVLAGRRDRFVLATKYGLSSDDSDPNAAGGHRKNLRRSLVALAWFRTRSRVVHPLVGVSRPEQIVDNLGSVELDLPPEAVDRLETASEFTPGFFADFIRDEDPS